MRAWTYCVSDTLALYGYTPARSESNRGTYMMSTAHSPYGQVLAGRKKERRFLLQPEGDASVPTRQGESSSDKQQPLYTWHRWHIKTTSILWRRGIRYTFGGASNLLAFDLSIHSRPLSRSRTHFLKSGGTLEMLSVDKPRFDFQRSFRSNIIRSTCLPHRHQTAPSCIYGVYPSI